LSYTVFVDGQFLLKAHIIVWKNCCILHCYHYSDKSCKKRHRIHSVDVSYCILYKAYFCNKQE